MSFSYFIVIIIVVLTACFWPCVPFAARATRGAFLILEGAVAAAMGCGGCIASCCWGPSQENLKIDYDRLVNVPWNCTVLSFLIPFIAGTILERSCRVHSAWVPLRSFWHSSPLGRPVELAPARYNWFNFHLVARAGIEPFPEQHSQHNWSFAMPPTHPETLEVVRWTDCSSLPGVLV